MSIFNGLFLLSLCVYSIGMPLDKRLLLDLFGHTFTNPGDMSSAFGTNNQPGDMTNYLDQYHQGLSAGATGSGYVQHQGHDGPAFSSQNAAYGHATDHLPGKCESSSTQTCAQDCLHIDSVTGCVVCKPNCHGTGSGSSQMAISQSSTSQNVTVTSAPSTASAVCPLFPTNCPRGNVALVNGCPICTAYQSAFITTTTRKPTTTTKATTTLSSTCAPLRCVAPCNKGVMLDSTGCPKCIC